MQWYICFKCWNQGMKQGRDGGCRWRRLWGWVLNHELVWRFLSVCNGRWRLRVWRWRDFWWVLWFWLWLWEIGLGGAGLFSGGKNGDTGSMMDEVPKRLVEVSKLPNLLNWPGEENKGWDIGGTWEKVVCLEEEANMSKEFMDWAFFWAWFCAWREWS